MRGAWGPNSGEKMSFEEQPEFDIGRPSESRRRNIPVVWIIVAFVFLFLAASQLYSIINPPGQHHERAELQRVLDSYKLRYIASPNEEAEQRTLSAAADEVSRMKFETAGVRGSAARILLVLRQEADPSTPPDFTEMNSETDDVEIEAAKPRAEKARKDLNQALRILYTADSLSPSEAEEIKRTIRETTLSRWPYPLAIERADRLSGKGAETERFTFVDVGLLFGVLLGVCLWIVYLASRVAGRLVPSGVPLGRAGPRVSDSLAFRLLLFLFAFALVPGLIALPLEPLVGEVWTSTIALIALLPLCWMILNGRALGAWVSARTLGLRLGDFWKNVAWGAAGWVANVPVLVALVLASEVLLRSLPGGEHPIERDIYTPGGFIPSLISAAVLAPLIEEAFFRGCLYQGLQARMRSAVWPVVLSSVAFASLHPQGAASWLVLGWIGAMGCMLFRQTGSLVAPVVMHGLNNGSVVLLLAYTG